MKIAIYLIFITIKVSGEKYHESWKDNGVLKYVTTFTSEDLIQQNFSKSTSDRVIITDNPKQLSTSHASVSEIFSSGVRQKETEAVNSQDSTGTLSHSVVNISPVQLTKIVKASSTTIVHGKTFDVSKIITEDIEKYTNNRQPLSTLFSSPLLSKVTLHVQANNTEERNNILEQSTTSSPSSKEISTVIPTKSKTSETRSTTSTSSNQPQKNTPGKYRPTVIDHKSDTRTRTPSTLTITSRKKIKTTKGGRKQTVWGPTETPKQKHVSKHFKTSLTSKFSSTSPKFEQKTTSKEKTSHPDSQHVYSTMKTIMPRTVSSNSSVVFTKISSKSRIPHILSTRKHFETKSISSIVTRSQKHTNRQDFLTTLRPQYRGETKILINEIVISQTKPNEQFIELKISSDFTHDLRSYKVVVFSGRGEVLSTIDMHGNTGKQYKILANEDIHVNIRKELEERKSLAVAVYHRSESVSSDITMHSKGVMDAIVLTAYDGKPSNQLMQNLMNDNVSPFHVSSSALKNGGSISRCAENHVRDTQDFMELSRPKATRGFRNMRCPKNIPTPSSNSFDNVKMTLAVVMSCLALFLVIVFFVVMMIKHKQRQIKLMQSSLWLKDDEDEDVVLKMGSVTFDENPENPTFKNDVYLTIKS
ncbi:uncharacterized protein LOC134283202 [Saccostrea cucullata]|uniref:uncharacterized protein LOC134283202 n=1 Tax=Saccostrea cuccullata TaxID=36930 RepID=UPI002ED323C5